MFDKLTVFCFKIILELAIDLYGIKVVDTTQKLCTKGDGNIMQDMEGIECWGFQFSESDRSCNEPLIHAYLESCTRVGSIMTSRKHLKTAEKENAIIKVFTEESKVFASENNEFIKKTILKTLLEKSQDRNIDTKMMLSLYREILYFIKMNVKDKEKQNYLAAAREFNYFHSKISGDKRHNFVIEFLRNCLDTYLQISLRKLDNPAARAECSRLFDLFKEIPNEYLIELTDETIDEELFEEIASAGLESVPLSKLSLDEDFKYISYLENKVFQLETQLYDVLNKSKATYEFVIEPCVDALTVGNRYDILFQWIFKLALRSIRKAVSTYYSSVFNRILEPSIVDIEIKTNDELVLLMPASTHFWYAVLVALYIQTPDQGEEKITPEIIEILLQAIKHPAKLRKAKCSNSYMKFKSNLQKYITPFTKGRHLELEENFSCDFLSSMPKQNALYLVAAHLSNICQKLDYTQKTDNELSKVAINIERDILHGFVNEMIKWAINTIEDNALVPLSYDDMLENNLFSDEKETNSLALPEDMASTTEHEFIVNLTTIDVKPEVLQEQKKEWFYLSNPRHSSDEKESIYTYGESTFVSINKIIRDNGLDGIVKTGSVVSALEYFDEMPDNEKMHIDKVKIEDQLWHKIKRGKLRILARIVDDGALIFNIYPRKSWKRDLFDY